MRHTAEDLMGLLHQGIDDFRDWPVSSNLSRSQRRKFFPVERSPPHTKKMLSGNTQRSQHCLLTCLSYFAQELELSPKARPCSHLDNCIIIFCLPKGLCILLNTIESHDQHQSTGILCTSRSLLVFDQHESSG